MENNGLRNMAHLYGLELSLPKQERIHETELNENYKQAPKLSNALQVNLYEQKKEENSPPIVWQDTCANIQPPTMNKVADYLYNGNLFSGTLVNGLPEGQGIIVYTKTNNTFEGLFHEGKIADQSNGKFIQRKGNNAIIYTGAFKNNNPSGHGRLEFMNKYIYEGDFMNNKKHGKGKITHLVDGTVYEGDFVNDKKHGKGKLINYNNGIIYEGDFVDDQIIQNKNFQKYSVIERQSNITKASKIQNNIAQQPLTKKLIYQPLKPFPQQANNKNLYSVISNINDTP